MVSVALPTVEPRPRLLPSRIAGACIAATGAGIALTRAPHPLEATLLIALCGVIGWIVAIDIQSLRAPNRIVYPAVAAALAAAALLGSSALAQASAGAVGAFAILLLVALLGRGAMGYGDVKAGALCGATTGLAGLIPMLAVAFVAGGLFAAVLLATRLRGRRDVVAFTPFLAIGVVASLAVSNGYLVT